MTATAPAPTVTAAAPVATLGDWQGCEPSLAMIDRSPDLRAQWLSRRMHRERLVFWGRVARYAASTGDTLRVPTAELHEAAAAYAPTSVWVVIAGEHDAWDAPADDEEWIAGPFATENQAAWFCDDEQREYSAVPRLPVGRVVA